MTSRTPSFYIPHGGGPCFFMEWTMGPADTWDKMGNWLKNLSQSVPVKPDALLVISAHWEEPEFTISSQPNPTLLYDYYGFPEHTYQLRYDAPGSPALAREMGDLLGEAGISSKFETERGLDHGVFIPFKLIYPHADIPVVQMSLKAGLDPAAHIAAGKALAPLRDRNILIVGSGMSYHNMTAFRMRAAPPGALAFDDWLNETVTTPSTDRRNESLTRWAQAPSAREAHPREEHLMPLMVVSGAAEDDQGQRTFNDRDRGGAISGFQFG